MNPITHDSWLALNAARAFYQDLNEEASLRPFITSDITGCLRRALEYSYRSIHRHIKPHHSATSRLHFPWKCPSQKQLRAYLERDLGQIWRSHTAIYEAIHQTQDFACGKQWLSYLCELDNHSKHAAPIKVGRSIRTPYFSFEDCSDVTIVRLQYPGGYINHLRFGNGEDPLSISTTGQAPLVLRTASSHTMRADLAAFLSDAVKGVETYLRTLDGESTSPNFV